MLKGPLLTLFAILGVAITTPTTVSCKIGAYSVPVPGLDDYFSGTVFKYYYVTSPPISCGKITVRLGNYGGRLPGDTLLLNAGQTYRFGPVPVYRTLERVLENGKVFSITIRNGGS